MVRRIRRVIQTVLFIKSSTWLPAGPLVPRSEEDSIWAPLCRSASTHQIQQYVWQPRSGHVLISVLHGVLRSTKFNQMTSPLSFHRTINSALLSHKREGKGFVRRFQSACLQNEVCMRKISRHQKGCAHVYLIWIGKLIWNWDSNLQQTGILLRLYIRYYIWIIYKANIHININ